MASPSRIVKGPGKFDLMLSLMDGEGDGRHRVTFTVIDDGGHERRIAVYIWKMEREGTFSSEEWVLGGLFVSGAHSLFNATYSTQTRTGDAWSVKIGE